MTHRLAVFTALSLALVTHFGAAQVATGTPPFGSFGGGPFDTVNVGNLNVHFGVPIVNKAGRGMPFYFNLSYDSSVWSPQAGAWVPDSTWGWRTQTNAVVGYVVMKTGTLRCQGEVGTSWRFGPYYDAFGTKHPFNLLVGDVCNAPDSGTATTQDGSGLTISVDLNLAPIITTRDGFSFNPPVNAPSGAATKSDSNGNFITTTGSSITDTLGTTVLSWTSSGSPPTYTYSYANPQSGTSPIRLVYNTYSVKTNFGCGITEYNQSGVQNNASLVSAIVLPDNTQYSIAYEPTYGSAGFVTGRIHSITLPSGGSISYSYSSDGSNTIGCTDGSTTWLKRSLSPGGDWTYVRALVSGSQWTTTITDPTPASNVTVLNFQAATTANGQNFYETNRKLYQGASTLLRTVVTCYNGITVNCDTTAITLPITQRAVTDQIPDSSGLQSEIITYYDSTYGTLTKTEEYDYGSNPGSVGSLARKTSISYAQDIGGIVDHPSLVSVSDRSGGLQAQTSYGYDETTPAASGVTVQHTNPTCPVGYTKCRGNLTTATYSVSTSSSLQRTFTYLDTGMPKTAVDVNAPGATTTYTYSSGSPSCNGAFATQVTLPIATLSRSMTWNCNGGVMTQLTDENGKSQNLTYNDANFWRPTTTTDLAGNPTAITYGVNPLSVESSLNFNGSVSTADLLKSFDGFGRIQYSQRKQVQGLPGSGTYDSVQTVYDNRGMLSQVSMAYAGSAGQSMPAGTPVTTWSYDALGRTTQIVDGGSGTTSWTPTGNDVLQSVAAPPSENNKQRQYEYDGLGRLASVCEITEGNANAPAGTCAQTNPKTGYWTKYTWNVLNNLLSVTQNVQSTTNNQTRTFTYDRLGRMLSETNPETNNLAYTYVYDTDATCGTSKGDLVKRTDAVGNVTCYAYDKMHRLAKITYPSGTYAANTPTKCFVYDAATVNSIAMANAKGRLAEASTGNGTSCPLSTKATDLGLSYSARGEVADAYESMPHSSGYYHVGATYWPHGLINQLTSNLSGLPTISYGGSGGASSLDGEGRILQVTASSGQSPVTGVTYTNSGTTQPIGSLMQVTFGSVDSDSFQYDVNTGRLTQYQFKMGTSTSVTGALGWNANGTLATLNITDQVNPANSQNCVFVHDDLARVASANCGSTIWSQTFSYDSYGNIRKDVPQGGTGIAFLSTYSSTTTSTNRLTAVGNLTPTYDNNGNLTYDTLHNFSWDVEGKMLSVDSTAVTLTYDALGRVVEQNRSGSYTEIVYTPGGGKLALMNGSTLVKAFVPLPGGATSVYAAGTTGPIFYRHSDWLGSSRLATTQSRTKYFDVSYAPFGENYQDSGTIDHSFTGQNQDTTASYYDFLLRQYSQVQGRWISPDPAGFSVASPSNPQSWNRYAYVWNSPLVNIDAFGLAANPPQPPPNPPPPPPPTLPPDLPPPGGHGCVLRTDVPGGAPYLDCGSGPAKIVVFDRILDLGGNGPDDANNEVTATISAGDPNAKKDYCSRQADQAALNTLLPGLGDSIYNYDNVDVAQNLTSGVLDSLFGFGTIAGQAMSWTSASDMALTNIRSATGLPKTFVSNGLKFAGNALTVIQGVQALAKSSEAYKACIASFH